MGSDDPSKISKSSDDSVEDLWFEVFKRSPVKTLCRFRCVCKSWNSLISSPFFIAHHFSSTATAAAEKPYLLLNGRQNTHKPYALYRPQDTLHQQISFLDFPFPTRNLLGCQIFSIIDVINGVVCLAPSSLRCDYSASLWNPSIHKYVNIPWSPSLDAHRTSYWHIGFGFDSSRNDFKVVGILHPSPGMGMPMYQVFSLQAGLWREVSAENVGFRKVISSNSCFINGAVHWIATKLEAPEDHIFRYALLLFDCESEHFMTMELPQELREAPFIPVEAKVFRYGSMLAVLKFLSWEDVCELWVMEKYGLVSTWNKLFRIEQQQICFGYSNFMLGEGGDVFVYHDVARLAPRNPSKKTVERFKRRKFYQPVNAYVFEESLFLMEQKKAVPCHRRRRKVG